MDIATETESRRLTPEELEVLAEFQALTNKQATLVKTFVATGDKAASVRAGYGGDMTEEQVRVGTYVYFQSPRVVRCIDKALGVDAKTRLLADLDDMLRNPKVTDRQIRAAELKMKTLGISPELSDEVRVEIEKQVSEKFAEAVKQEIKGREFFEA